MGTQVFPGGESSHDGFLLESSQEGCYPIAKLRCDLCTMGNLDSGAAANVKNDNIIPTMIYKQIATIGGRGGNAMN